MENLGKFAIGMAHDQNIINREVRYIIENTGAPGTMFQVVKHYLYGEKNESIDEIFYQNTLRKMM